MPVPRVSSTPAHVPVQHTCTGTSTDIKYCNTTGTKGVSTRYCSITSTKGVSWNLSIWVDDTHTVEYPVLYQIYRGEATLSSR